MAAAGPVAAVPGLDIERAVLIDAQPHPAGRATRIQPFEPAVLGPELRVGGLLPRLGAASGRQRCLISCKATALAPSIMLFFVESLPGEAKRVKLQAVSVLLMNDEALAHKTCLTPGLRSDASGCAN